MLKYRNKIVNAPDTTDKRFILNAISLLNGINVNIFPNNKNSGAPGGCGTCNL